MSGHGTSLYIECDIIVCFSWMHFCSVAFTMEPMSDTGPTHTLRPLHSFFRVLSVCRIRMTQENIQLSG